MFFGMPIGRSLGPGSPSTGPFNSLGPIKEIQFQAL
jgi:hypothetical protein